MDFFDLGPKFVLRSIFNTQSKVANIRPGGGGSGVRLSVRSANFFLLGALVGLSRPKVLCFDQALDFGKH